MDTEQVAKRLVELCGKGSFDQAAAELYAPDIVSVEAEEMPNMSRRVQGTEAVKKKAQWWNANHTVHSVKVGGPFVANDKFAVTFDMDATYKPQNKHIQMTEAAVYTVHNGKIVQEEFLSACK